MAGRPLAADGKVGAARSPMPELYQGRPAAVEAITAEVNQARAHLDRTIG
jgi:hypothetical protein